MKSANTSALVPVTSTRKSAVPSPLTSASSVNWPATVL